MIRLCALFVGILLVLSVGLGSVAHATEGTGCVETTTANASNHSIGDADQVSGDADNAYPHHHGGCHGHHIGVPSSADIMMPAGNLRSTALAWGHAPEASVEPDPALRPPRA